MHVFPNFSGVWRAILRRRPRSLRSQVCLTPLCVAARAENLTGLLHVDALHGHMHHDSADHAQPMSASRTYTRHHRTLKAREKANERAGTNNARIAVASRDFANGLPLTLQLTDSVARVRTSTVSRNPVHNPDRDGPAAALAAVTESLMKLHTQNVAILRTLDEQVDGLAKWLVTMKDAFERQSSVLARLASEASAVSRPPGQNMAHPP